MSEHHSIIIIGAGLSGLYAAWQLHQQSQDVLVLEARDRVGGRILSANTEQDSSVDMGPAWVWPQLQPRLQQLITQLDLVLFRQFTRGDMLVEFNPNQIERYQQSAHHHSYRITGGSQQLTDALESALPANAIQLETQVTAIDQQQSIHIHATTAGKSRQYTADRIILALPPRVLQQTIQFTPPFAQDIQQQWAHTPTWMAGQCKIAFLYDRAFWREQQLSGEVLSHHGPLAQMYDSSPQHERYFALTAFVGLSSEQRQHMSAEALIAQSLTQLQRLFGDASQQVKDVHLKDWSQDEHTATQQDLVGASGHPEYPKTMPLRFWDNRLILAGTEVAGTQGGYLEGALASAEVATMA